MEGVDEEGEDGRGSKKDLGRKRVGIGKMEILALEGKLEKSSEVGKKTKGKVIILEQNEIYVVFISDDLQLPMVAKRRWR